jgi:tetratricopeptide (TPR) repeat protein
MTEFRIFRSAGLGFGAILLIMLLKVCLFSGGAFTIKQVLGNSKSTVKETTAILQQNPSNYEAYTRRGDAYYAALDSTSAVQDYSSAIGIMPSAGLYNKRAEVYGLMGNDELARKDRAMALTMKR